MDGLSGCDTSIPRTRWLDTGVSKKKSCGYEQTLALAREVEMTKMTVWRSLVWLEMAM